MRIAGQLVVALALAAALVGHLWMIGSHGGLQVTSGPQADRHSGGLALGEQHRQQQTSDGIAGHTEPAEHPRAVSTTHLAAATCVAVLVGGLLLLRAAARPSGAAPTAADALRLAPAAVAGARPLHSRVELGVVLRV